MSTNPGDTCNCGGETHTEPGLRPGDGGTHDEPVDTRGTVVCVDCGTVLERLEPLPDED